MCLCLSSASFLFAGCQKGVQAEANRRLLRILEGLLGSSSDLFRSSKLRRTRFTCARETRVQFPAPGQAINGVVVEEDHPEGLQRL